MVSPQGKKAHCRYFILFNDLLMYCKMVRAAPSLANSLRCSCVLPLKKCLIDEILSKGMFKITCQNETLLLYSTVIEEGESWITAVKEAVKQYHECRQTLRKDSSSRRPMRRPDFANEVMPLHTLRMTRKRRISVQDYNETYSNPCSENENMFAQLLRRKSSLQENPRKIIKLNSVDNENCDFQENEAVCTEGPKDSLFPMRDSLSRRNMIAVTTQDNNMSPGTKEIVPTQGNYPEDDKMDTRSSSSDDLQRTTWHLQGLCAIRKFLSGFSRSIRRHVFRQVPHVPAFE